jgi:hypothetical protein
VEDLLDDLCVRDQALPTGYRQLEQRRGYGLVGMLSPNEVHGDVGVDEVHRLPALR